MKLLHAVAFFVVVAFATAQDDGAAPKADGDAPPTPEDEDAYEDEYEVDDDDDVATPMPAGGDAPPIQKAADPLPPTPDAESDHALDDDEPSDEEQIPPDPYDHMNSEGELGEEDLPMFPHEEEEEKHYDDHWMPPLPPPPPEHLDPYLDETYRGHDPVGGKAHAKRVIERDYHDRYEWHTERVLVEHGHQVRIDRTNMHDTPHGRARTLHMLPACMLVDGWYLSVNDLPFWQVKAFRPKLAILADCRFEFKDWPEGKDIRDEVPEARRGKDMKVVFSRHLPPENENLRWKTDKMIKPKEEV